MREILWYSYADIISIRRDWIHHYCNIANIVNVDPNRGLIIVIVFVKVVFICVVINCAIYLKINFDCRF